MLEKVIERESRKRRVVLLGFGKHSIPLTKKIRRILRQKYGIESTLPAEVNSGKYGGVKKSFQMGAHYDDGEPYSKMPSDKERRNLFNGAEVYIIQPTRVYDQGEGYNPCDRMQQVKNLALVARGLGARRITCVTPKTSFEWNHHFRENMKLGVFETPILRQYIRELRSLGVTGTIAIHLHAPHEYREFAQEPLLELPPEFQELKDEGNLLVRSMVEAIESPTKMDVIDLIPFGTTTVNGTRVSLEEVLGLTFRDAHPYDKDICATIKRKRREYRLPDDLAKSLVVICCVDQGALEATEDAALHYGLERVISKKKRSDEGKTVRGHCQSLWDYLDQLAERLPRVREREYVVTILNLDDKLNTGGTLNNESRARKIEVDIYNRGLKAKIFGAERREGEDYDTFLARLERELQEAKSSNSGYFGEVTEKRIVQLKEQIYYLRENPRIREHQEGHGTKFKVYCKSYCSHMRTPNLRRLKHNHLDEVVISDTVPYDPPLMEQFRELERGEPEEFGGITRKISLVNFTAAMLAAGIAYHYLHFERKTD